MNYTIDDIADFILVHYTMSNRQDTFFWKDMKELGVKLKHKDLIIEKINHINNSMKSSVVGYTTYPDYMWMQLAVSWGLDIPKRNLNKDISEVYSHVFYQQLLDLYKNKEAPLACKYLNIQP